MVSCLGLLVQSCCGEGRALQINVTGMCGDHSQCFSHTGFAPAHVCFPCLHCSGSRLFYREQALSYVHFPGLSCSGSGFRVLHKDTDWLGPAFCAFPGLSSSDSQELDELHSPPVQCTLFPTQSQPQFPGAGPVHLVSLLGS